MCWLGLKNKEKSGSIKERSSTVREVGPVKICYAVEKIGHLFRTREL